jgi:S1-C subfamily serine protease
MVMSMQRKHICLFLGTLLFAILAGRASGQAHTGDTPSLQALKALRFSKLQKIEQTQPISYSDILEVINSAKAYARGLTLLPNYHEPILTRGPAGVALFRRISPSVVLVMTGDVKDDTLTNIGIGTGVIVASPGYVLTNWHVISGYETAAIFFKPASGTDPSKSEAFGARLIVADQTADLALLKIIKPPVGLAAVKLGDISTVQVAEDIHIIGHPHGLFWSYTTGVVSQLRDAYQWSYSDGSKHSAKVVQMQTAINPGNSGGPVLDDNGNILGLVAMSEEGQNLNYAIAVDEIKRFVDQAMSAGTRGGESSHNAEPSERAVGETADGLKVNKYVYGGLTMYCVYEYKGSVVGLVAESSDGTVLSATKPNEFGGFSDWTIELPNHKRVLARASGAFPETFATE